MKAKPVLLLMLVILLAACQSVPTGTPEALPSATIVPTPVPGVLYVDPAQDLGPISPYIYGSNYGPMHAVTLEMQPYAFDAGITVLRFPGGAWGDQSNINTFQIDAFMDFCAQMGAMPTISVRLFGGTPEQAAEMVRYTNIEKGYGVLYWSIGNEPTLFEQQYREPYDTVRFNQEWRAIAEAMLAVDPSIQLLGPELHGSFTSNFATNPKDSAGRDWMVEFLKANGDLVDVVTYHRYPFPQNGEMATLETLRQDPPEWNATVAYLRALVQDMLGRDLPIAVTEVGSDSSAVMMGEATPDSFASAIWYADVLGRMAQQRVFMVNQWVLSQRTTGLGLFQGNTIRPTYYTFLLYKKFGSELLYASSGIPDVSIYAARGEEGALTLMVVNLSDSEQRVPLQIAGMQPDSAFVWLFDASHNAEALGVQAMPQGGMLILPAWSATLYVISE
jgi:hypothetical protein